MADELFRFDQNEGPFGALARQARANPQAAALFAQALAPANHAALGKINPAILKPGAAPAPGGHGMLGGHRRYPTALGSVDVTAVNPSVTLTTITKLEDCRLFFDDPTGILYGVIGLIVGGRTVNLNFATLTATGGTPQPGYLSAAQLRVQAQNFDIFQDGVPIGDIDTNTIIQIQLRAAWTAGTPPIGFMVNSPTTGGWNNLPGAIAGCECPTP